MINYTLTTKTKLKLKKLKIHYTHPIIHTQFKIKKKKNNTQVILECTYQEDHSRYAMLVISRQNVQNEPTYVTYTYIYIYMYICVYIIVFK